MEYNTSTNPTFEGAVRDTSGRGNDGVFYGGASYDATQKALVFDGTASDQFVHTLKNGRSESGNIDYSVSLWFNPTTVNVARWRAIFAIGVLDRTQPTDNNGDEITLFVNNGTNALHLQNGGSSVNTGALNAGQWVHIVVTYDGTNRKIYLDGSLSVSNGYTSLNLPKEMLIRLAQSIPNGDSEIDEYMDCKISNFKAWFGAALTAQEVKTLYDMGRSGNVIPKPLHVDTTLQVNGLFQGNSPLQFFVVNGQFPASGSTQTVTDLPQGLKDRIRQVVFIQGLTVQANGDNFTWIRHGSTTWEVDIKVIMNPPSILLSGFDASVNLTSKAWRIFVVTT